MNVWGQPSKGRSNGSSAVSAEVTSELDIFLAEEVAQRTRELLATRGWCLWKCASLNSEVIALARDELVEGVPEGPVYTEAELEELCQDGVSEATLRLAHEAKKLAGAKVTTEVTKRGGDSWRSWN